MAEIEIPTEHLHEEMQHHAAHSGASWVMMTALTSALLAVLASVAALLSGHHENEAMLSQIKSANQWNYYQAKGIKSIVLKSQLDILASFQKPIDPKDERKLETYQSEQEEISRQADEFNKESVESLRLHNTFSRSVTLFQIAIGIAAISVLAKKPMFWILSLLFGGCGIYFLTMGLI